MNEMRIPEYDIIRTWRKYHETHTMYKHIERLNSGRCKSENAAGLTKKRCTRRKAGCSSFFDQMKYRSVIPVSDPS